MHTSKSTIRVGEKALIVLMIVLIGCFLVSCGSEQTIQNTETVKKDDIQNTETQKKNEYPISGHLLYGYKHGLKIYGQYMDSAGENNAMILIFVNKENECTVEVQCKSVTINGLPVEFSIIPEHITPNLTAMQINITSTEAKIDELLKSDTASIVFDIIDSNNGSCLEITKPITFPC